MSKSNKIDLIVGGKRLDGRDFFEVREIEMKVNVVNNADGSAMVRFGNTTAIAAVYGPRLLLPKFLQEEKAVLRCRYNMTPFSTDERKTPGHDRRSIELSKVIKSALEPAIFLEDFPKTRIDVFIDIVQADGSTRVASINAASLALAMAGIPMRDLVVACTAGKINGCLVLDLNGKEDNFGEADLSFAMMYSKNRVTLLQTDGEFSYEEIEILIKELKKACEKIYEMQKSTLKDYYQKYVE
ncbi:MAG: exosome complex exonuclease Rrp41 [Candidatus Aenigmarchaeota archaeon]|nr:exosome complex exonuclease Rrp41 [Candidatus Aenigmarchaeota archaeon]MDW8149215.1 exosome complex exonuclease Rrp41 [Candidatus Aenigmarchaeota archaeon]